MIYSQYLLRNSNFLTNQLIYLNSFDAFLTNKTQQAQKLHRSII
jgi:hypothetical protein